MHRFPLILLFLFGAACTERIDISTQAAPPRLVIYGYITSDTTRHSIRITRSAGYFTTDRPEGVSNAAVTISTGNRRIPLTENDTVPGLYQTADNVYGLSDATYTLDVLLDFDSDGTQEHYRSSAYLARLNHIDSIALQPSTIFRGSVEVLLYAQDLPEENFYSVFVSINDSLLNPSINGFFVMDDVFFNGVYMNGVSCFFIDPEDDEGKKILQAGDKVTLNINAIPKEYATFISNVQSEIRGSNPIFGGPPANVETNIRCIEPPDAVEVSGFFTAYPCRYADVTVKTDFSELPN
ncbi:MAG: DUF4249 domain-containing protein [Bacteroidales bacterium]|jgi:hypothetical protein|nr:DUF4249 domain-containing protein [Bacteroidales bacterium]